MGSQGKQVFTGWMECRCLSVAPAIVSVKALEEWKWCADYQPEIQTVAYDHNLYEVLVRLIYGTRVFGHYRIDVLLCVKCVHYCFTNCNLFSCYKFMLLQVVNLVHFLRMQICCSFFSVN